MPTIFGQTAGFSAPRGGVSCPRSGCGASGGGADLREVIDPVARPSPGDTSGAGGFPRLAAFTTLCLLTKSRPGISFESGPRCGPLPPPRAGYPRRAEGAAQEERTWLTPRRQTARAPARAQPRQPRAAAKARRRPRAARSNPAGPDPGQTTPRPAPASAGLFRATAGFGFDPSRFCVTVGRRGRSLHPGIVPGYWESRL